MPEQLKIDFKNMVIPNQKSIFNQKVMEESLRELLKDSSFEKVNIYDFRRIRMPLQIQDVFREKRKSICNIVFASEGSYYSNIRINDKLFRASVGEIPSSIRRSSEFSEALVPTVVNAADTRAGSIMAGVINNNILITLSEEAMMVGDIDFREEICKYILQTSVSVLLMSYDDIIKQKKELLRKTSVERFALIISKDQEKKEADICARKKNVEMFLEKAEQETKKLYTLQAEVDAFKTNIKEVAEKKFAEIFSIEELDSVNSVNVTEAGSIEIITNEIVCKSGSDRRYKFGRYKINYDLTTGSITFENLEEYNKRVGYWGAKCQHPHISTQGKACLGNVAATLSMLFTTMEWKALASVLLSFLEAVNTSDVAGAQVSHWDYYDEFGNLIPSQASAKICAKCGKTIPAGVLRFFASNGKQEDSNIYCESCIEFKDNKYIVKEG